MKINLIDKIFMETIYDFLKPESNPCRIFLALKIARHTPCLVG